MTVDWHGHQSWEQRLEGDFMAMLEHHSTYRVSKNAMIVVDDLVVDKARTSFYICTYNPQQDTTKFPRQHELEHFVFSVYLIRRV